MERVRGLSLRGFDVGMGRGGELHGGEGLAGDVDAAEAEKVVFALVAKFVSRTYKWNTEMKALTP